MPAWAWAVFAVFVVPLLAVTVIGVVCDVRSWLPTVHFSRRGVSDGAGSFVRGAALTAAGFAMIAAGFGIIWLIRWLVLHPG